MIKQRQQYDFSQLEKTWKKIISENSIYLPQTNFDLSEFNKVREKVNKLIPQRILKNKYI